MEPLERTHVPFLENAKSDGVTQSHEDSFGHLGRCQCCSGSGESRKIILKIKRSATGC